MSVNDGGPAFPVSTRANSGDTGYGHQDTANTFQFSGLTLRDYFAAKAMQSIALDVWNENDDDHDERLWWQVIADRSYLIADAMLIKRSE
jgi:hypothetical protein